MSLLLKSCLVIYLLAFISSCKEEEVEYQTNKCSVQPPFIRTAGFDPARSALSTSEKRTQGLVLIQLGLPGDTGSNIRQVFQYPSWKMAGTMGPIQIDPVGNVFVAPVPTINMLTNPTEKQNIVYKVDRLTGEMKQFVSLPLPSNIPQSNPYGILGMAYLCEADILYVSSVMGSEINQEKGKIYALDPASGKVLDTYEDMDVIGLGITYITGQRRLYMASARTPDIYSIQLKQDGTFGGKAQIEFSIADQVANSNERVRKIRFDNNDHMELHTVAFNYNLSAPTESKETVLRLMYDPEIKKWQFIK